MQEVFEKIYHLHHWYDKESLSGPGASLMQTKAVRTILSTVLKEHHINTILDIPCGDFNWMREIDLTPYNYLGADIVNDIIAQNESMYSKQGRQFMWADITSSALPIVDLLFCRDCLVHFSYSDIIKAIANIKKFKSKFLLTTTFPNRVNDDILTGSWRPLNLEADPFLFPAPIQLFNENCTEGYGMFADKSLALWSIDSLPDYTGINYPQ